MIGRTASDDMKLGAMVAISARRIEEEASRMG